MGCEGSRSTICGVGTVDAKGIAFYARSFRTHGQFYRSSSVPDEPVMNKVQEKKFRELLDLKRREIIKRAQQTLDEDMTLDANELPDEMDLASSEYLQSFTFRLRGREKVFLEKIQKAIERLDNGTFGVCEECGDRISVKRLEARPETTLCIRCKEDQERVEKDFG
jgi:DnaK suppressor protein